MSCIASERDRAGGPDPGPRGSSPPGRLAQPTRPNGGGRNSGSWAWSATRPEAGVTSWP